MRSVLPLYKPVGITPLACIKNFISKHPEYANSKLGYAGRLDPMAEGLLLVLVGDENKKRKAYEALPKTYEAEIVFGITTDTYDALGMITKTYENPWSSRLHEQLNEVLPALVGKHIQVYPPYSSQPVNGKPLYYWARHNTLSEITIPKKEIKIKDIQLLSFSSITAHMLHSYILTTVSQVIGDFRQKEIIEQWKTFFRTTTHTEFPCVKLRISCSSGTYIRSLANNLGNTIHTGGFALKIKRIQVGDYVI